MAFKTPHPIFQTTDTFQQLVDDLNTYGNTVDSDLGYVDSAIGPDAGSGFYLNGLLTTSGNLIDAINELDSDLHGIGGGTFKTLTTTEAKTVVGAINEIEAVFDANAGTIDVDSALAVTSEGAMTFNGGSTGNFEVDVAGDIILDADGGDLAFKDGGVTAYNFSSTGTIARSGDLTIDVSGDINLDADGNDIIFKNGAGGDQVQHSLANTGAYVVTYPNTVTHTQTAGDLAFNVAGKDVTFGDGSNERIRLNLEAAPNIYITGTSASISNSAGNIKIDAVGDVEMDAATGQVNFDQNGVQYAAIYKSGSDVIFRLASNAIGFTVTSTNLTVPGVITLPSSGTGTITSSEISANTVHGAIDEVNARIPNVYNRAGTLLNP
jgi:hypothetical protein